MPEMPRRAGPIPPEVAARLALGDDALLDVRRDDDGERVFVQIARVDAANGLATPIAHIRLSREQAAHFARVFAELAGP